MPLKAIFLFNASYGKEYVAINTCYKSKQCDRPHGQEICDNCGHAWALCEEPEDAHIWHCMDMAHLLICKDLVELALECDALDIEIIEGN